VWIAVVSGLVFYAVVLLAVLIFPWASRCTETNGKDTHRW